MKKKNPIRLIIVDDHPAFRAGLAALLESQPDMTIVAETGDSRELIDIYRRLLPDIVLIDLRMPGLSGVEAIIALRNKFPDARAVVVTTYDLDEDIYRAIQSGAKSYLLKDMSESEIAGTIRAVYRGEQVLPPSVAHRLAERSKRQELTSREIEILKLLTKGSSNKEMASRLFLSEETVKSHLKTLFLKLGVHDRTEAVITAFRHGIVHLD